MCQLFAVTGRRPVQVNEEVKYFLQNSFIHKHGWGYSDFTGGKTFVKRETTPAYESEFAKKLLAAPLLLQSAMFHIRYATVGAVEHENTHPLTAMDLMGRQWTIIHNGTVFNFDKLDKYFYKQNGTTDTERLLLYLVERVNQKSVDSHRPLTDEERFRVVDKVLRAVAEGNKLNVVLYDSEVMYVHANSRTGSRVLGESGKNDFLYELEAEDARFFSTVPLDGRAWAPVRLNTLLAYKDGALTQAGAAHDFEYIESDEDIRYLYRGFSAL
ncbi:MAG: class II glutamine amidotransferase [Clostridiales Family XIII bacterium]|jgi:glutamine amidotransferase|nr:class II glutamine amidotransferase [Clostridiales Family XIII bacterium]